MKGYESGACMAMQPSAWMFVFCLIMVGPLHSIHAKDGWEHVNGKLSALDHEWVCKPCDC